VTPGANLEIAIRNFIGHCQAIPTALGFPGTQTPHFSSNPHTLNIPYPQGITTGGPDNSKSQLVQIQQFLASRPPNTLTGVVDSYSTLDKPGGHAPDASSSGPFVRCYVNLISGYDTRCRGDRYHDERPRKSKIFSNEPGTARTNNGRATICAHSANAWAVWLAYIHCKLLYFSASNNGFRSVPIYQGYFSTASR
jgi:hypothetical protein